MIPTEPRQRGSSKFAPINGKRRKQSKMGMMIGAGVTFAIVLLAGTIFAWQQSASHAAPATYHFVNRDNDHNNFVTTINGLKKISQVGSTENILDTHGKKITVDANPYKIAMTPSWFRGDMVSGDLVVSNFGAMNKGTTLVRFPNQKGPSRLFNRNTDGLSGPSGLVFNMQTNSLWVANSSGNDILLFRPNGTLWTTIKSGLFHGPWSLTSNSTRFGNDRMAKISFFTANDVNGNILRIDVIPQRNGGTPRIRVVQIGHIDTTGNTTFIDTLWLPTLRVNNRTWNDVLLALDPVHNRIAAFANSSTMSGHGEGLTVFQGNPLKMPGGLALNPINGDLLVVNGGNNNLVELNLTNHRVIGVKQIDPATVDAQGNGAALFGILATRDRRGNLEVFFTDDNTNSLDLLSVS